MRTHVTPRPRGASALRFVLVLCYDRGMLRRIAVSLALIPLAGCHVFMVSGASLTEPGKPFAGIEEAHALRGDAKVHPILMPIGVVSDIALLPITIPAAGAHAIRNVVKRHRQRREPAEVPPPIPLNGIPLPSLAE